MTSKPIRRRAQARRDVDAAAFDYASAGGPDLGERFVAAVEEAMVWIGEGPATGSLRWAETLGIADLRNWPVRDFPYRIFYIERADHIDVARVLHAQSDIATHLADLD